VCGPDYTLPAIFDGDSIVRQDHACRLIAEHLDDQTGAGYAGVALYNLVQVLREAGVPRARVVICVSAKRIDGRCPFGYNGERDAAMVSFTPNRRAWPRVI